MFEETEGPPAFIGPRLRPPTPPPTAKKLGKRPMTALQLEAYYAKQPKLAIDYDSDVEREPLRTSTLSNWTTAPQMAYAVSVQVAAEDEHARDLLEALNRDSPMPASPPHTPVPHTPHTAYITSDNRDNRDNRDAAIAELANLFGDTASDRDDPGRLVPDPFLPDEYPRLTAVERDAVVEDEQYRRRQQGLPLLRRDPEDEDRWVEPAQLADATVVKREVPEFADDDIYV